MDYLKGKLLSLDTFNRLINEGGEDLESYNIRKIISSKDKIHSLLLMNGR